MRLLVHRLYSGLCKRQDASSNKRVTQCFGNSGDWKDPDTVSGAIRNGKASESQAGFVVLPLKRYSDICMKMLSVLSLYLIVQTPPYLHDFTSEMTE